MDFELRYASVADAQLRIAPASESAGLRVSGYAVVWDAPSVSLPGRAGPFVERIQRGAFDESLSARGVSMYWMHDSSKVLANTASDTLEIVSDERGLAFAADLVPTRDALDAIELIRAGVVAQMSFGFTVRDDSWEGRNRTVRAADLHEISLVERPAYPQTSAGVRSLSDRLRAIRMRYR